MAIIHHLSLLSLTSSHLNWGILLVAAAARVLPPRYVALVGGVYACLVAAPTTAIVPGLQNTLAIIHPSLILLLYSIAVVAAVTWRFTVFKSLNLVVLWVVLGLGGWWAFQEFTWGGWWNWDVVETPVLLISFFWCWWSVHCKNKVRATLWHNKYLLAVYVLGAVCLTRYGVGDSVHSFISKATTYGLYYSCAVSVSTGAVFALTHIEASSFIFLKASVLTCAVLAFIYIAPALRPRPKQTVIAHITATIILVWVCAVNLNYYEVLSHKMSGQTYQTATSCWYKPQTSMWCEYLLHINNLSN